MLLDRSTVLTHDGLHLAVEHHVVANARADVVIVHGFGEHSGRYARVTASLTASGLGCHLFDLRGHGASEGPRGHVGAFEDFRDDLQRVVGRIRDVAAPERPRPAIPLIVLGHSMGALIALDHVIHLPGTFAALVLSSPFIAPAIAPSRVQSVLGACLNRVWPTLAFRAPLDAHWLSHDRAIVDAYRNDPLVHDRVTLRLWQNIERAQHEMVVRAGEVTLPALFLLAGDDHVVDASAAVAFFRGMGSVDKHLVTYEDYFHEVLNEPGADRVLADLRRWLDELFPPPGPR